jgi:hypothetical protein
VAALLVREIDNLLPHRERARQRPLGDVHAE